MRKNGKCLWTYPIEPTVMEKAKVKIIDGYLVFFSSMMSSHKLHYDNRLLFLNLNTGAEAFEVKGTNKLGVGKVAFCGNRVFTLLCGDDKIKEWSPEGKCIKSIPTNSNTGILSCSDKYLIHAYQNRICINYLTKERHRRIIHLPKCGTTWQKIKCLFLDGDRLFCGFTSQSTNTLYNFHIINLEKGCISKSYVTPKCEDAALSSNNYVKSIAVFNDRVFIGNSKGEIAAVNLSEEIPKYCLLEQQHSAPVNKLIISNNILISTSDCHLVNHIPAEIKFWDLNTLKQINSANLPSLSNCHFDNWNCVVGTEESIVKWDFKNFHQGEKFTDGSATEVKMWGVEDDDSSLDRDSGNDEAFENLYL
jgi:hypothetical protein